MKEMTLLFLKREDEVLLAMKKRGFGKDRWNGVGGKVEQGEDILTATIREAQEEIGVTPKNIRQVGRLVFYAFHEKEFKELEVHIFTSEKWDGEPIETEEMRPEWFNVADVPYELMWDDDKYWLPKVLKGKTITGRFDFDQNDIVTSWNIKENTL